MSGKVLAITLVVVSLIFAASMYYLQVYAFFEEAPADTEIRLVNLTTGKAEVILTEGFAGIDATSSPLRFRGCFATPMSLATLTETYEAYEGAVPLVGPGWFDCFDAVAIGQALEQGEALAFLGQKDVHDGVDRVIAVFPGGQAFVWHQLNEKYTE